MTEASTQKSGSRPWTLSLTPTTPFNEGTGSNDTPYMNFRADIETSRGIKNRFVSVFNTQRFPTLIEDVKSALASGPARVTLRFEYDQGETVKILGVGHVSFRKPANDVGPAADAVTDSPPQDETVEMEIVGAAMDETPMGIDATGTIAAVDAATGADSTVAKPVAAEPAAAAVAPMQGVIVETKVRKKRRLKAA